MAAQGGRLMLIKIEDSPGVGTYTTVGGLRAKSFDINNQPVDTSDSDSRWQQLSMGMGLKSISVSGSGVFKDSTTENLVRTSQANDLTPNFQIVVPGVGTYSGAFAITSLKFAGGHNNEMNFDFGLASAGDIAFA